MNVNSTSLKEVLDYGLQDLARVAVYLKNGNTTLSWVRRLMADGLSARIDITYGALIFGGYVITWQSRKYWTTMALLT